MHFRTNNAKAKDIAATGDQTGNTVSDWNTGFTALSGHSANLPLATEEINNDPTGGFWNEPFRRQSNYHWNVRATEASNNRWECDDVGLSDAHTTRHLIWARMVA